MTGTLTMSVLRTLLTVWYLCCQPVLGSIDDLPWPEAYDLIQTVCPYGSVCELPSIKQGIKTSCCRGCSCEPDCASKGNCCFPKQSASEEETCIFPRTRFTDKYIRSSSDFLTKSYYTVTKSPTNGCINSISDGCDAGEAAMAPVYSQEKNKVYVNGACAKCHGVSEFIEWESALVCDGLGSSATMDFEKEITSYLRNRSTSTCFLIFFLHENVGVNNRSCLMPGFESMLDIKAGDSQTSIDPTLNVSMDAILDACKSNFYAPIKSENKWYPNPFCFLYDERELCSPICQTRAENVFGLEYMTLLDPQLKAILTSNDERQGPSIPMACLQDTSGSQGPEYRPCRPVTCPFGHIQNPDGSCMFFGREVYFKGLSSFSVHILLQRSTHHPKVNEPLTEETLTVADIMEGLGVPPDWTVALVAIPSEQAGNEAARDELIIQLHPLIKNSIDALATLKTQLSKSITIWDGTRTRIYSQKIYPLTVSFAQTFTESSMEMSCCVEMFDSLSTAHSSSNSGMDISGHNDGSSDISDIGDEFDEANSQTVNTRTGKMRLDPNSDTGHISQAPTPYMYDIGLDTMSVLGTTERVPLPGLTQRNQGAIPDIGTTHGPPMRSTSSRNQGAMSDLYTTDRIPQTSLSEWGQNGVPDLDIKERDRRASANAINDDDTASTRRKRRTLRRMGIGQGNSVDDLTSKQKDGHDNPTPKSNDVLSVLVNGESLNTRCWKPLFTNFRVNSETIAITKLYFCDTVELMAGEFRLMANDSVLFVETKRIYLYENEFIILENSNMNKTVKVCLEDSWFVRSIASSEGNTLRFLDALLVVQLLHIVDAIRKARISY